MRAGRRAGVAVIAMMFEPDIVMSRIHGVKRALERQKPGARGATGVDSPR
jgi:hypothetical protein